MNTYIRLHRELTGRGMDSGKAARLIADAYGLGREAMAQLAAYVRGAA